MYTLKEYDNLYREFIVKNSREFKYKCIVDDVLLEDYQLSNFSIESDLVNEGNEFSIGNGSLPRESGFQEYGAARLWVSFFRI
jgi:hypothetical protein